MRVQKVEWLTAYVKAHQSAFWHENILGGFRGTGIYPLLPSKVLDRFTLESPNAKSNRAPTPPIPSTPFNNDVLTSSPVDFNAIHKANAELNLIISNIESISTPVKKYIGCLSRTVERLHAEKTIYQQESEERGAILGARKCRLSGKRKVIDGKHVLS